MSGRVYRLHRMALNGAEMAKAMEEIQVGFNSMVEILQAPDLFSIPTRSLTTRPSGAGELLFTGTGLYIAMKDASTGKLEWRGITLG